MGSSSSSPYFYFANFSQKGKKISEKYDKNNHK